MTRDDEDDDRVGRQKFTITITVTDEETEEEVEHELPAKYEICSRCEGHGHHSNPSIDGNGITESEFREWDDEEKERYFSGGYDIPCEAKCEGGKVRVPDPGFDDKLIDLVVRWNEQQETSARYDEEDRQTRKMESGGWDR